MPRQYKTKQTKRNKRGNKWQLRWSVNNRDQERSTMWTRLPVWGACVLMRVYPVMRGCLELLSLHSHAGRSVLICSTAGDGCSSIMMTACDLLCFFAVSVPYIALCLSAALYVGLLCFFFVFVFKWEAKSDLICSGPTFSVKLSSVSSSPAASDLRGNYGDVQHWGFRWKHQSFGNVTLKRILVSVSFVPSPALSFLWVYSVVCNRGSDTKHQSRFRLCLFYGIARISIYWIIWENKKKAMSRIRYQRLHGKTSSCS